MFKTLLEMSDPTMLRLTDIQKAVLLTIFIAQTPQLAFEATTGSRHIIQSRDFLVATSLITVSNDGAKITGSGLEVLTANGLIDETEQLTELAQKLMDWFDEQKRALMESKTPFGHIKNMLNVRGGA